MYGTSWVMAALFHTNRESLRGVVPQLFQEYLDYQLGEHVLGLTTKGMPEVLSFGPTWELILNYDLEVRRAAMKSMIRGNPLPHALREAWRDQVVKGQALTTPLALLPRTVASEHQPSRTSSTQPPSKRIRRGGKGSGSGKGKGPARKGGKVGSKSRNSECASRTPEGDNICYACNTAAERCTMKGCPFKHVCGKCIRPKVPLYSCDHKNQ